MKAYLEKIGGEWLDDFVYMSVEPLKALGFEIQPFDGDDLEDTLGCYVLNIDKDVIIGSVEGSNFFFKECGIEPPKYLGYPTELYKYLGRDVHQTKLGLMTIPSFIKPANDVKLFTGSVIENKGGYQMLLDYSDADENTEILQSELVDFVSEYRCFVHEDTLKGIQFYLGDFKIFPHVGTIEAMIEAYESANCAYTLDVGVTADGRTLLVEVNDMWAIGAYGFNSRDYVLMCVRRMREIGRQAKGETIPLYKRLKK